MRKYTIEYVKECFEKEGYRVLTEVYTGCKQKIEFICPNGHQHRITLDKWFRGQRCYYCNGNIKLTHKFIEESFEKEDYKLLSKYRNSSSKLKYVCPEGHVGYIKWDHWRDGHRCAECAGNKKHTLEFVENEFAKEGYKLLSDVYINSYTPLKYKCSNNHEGTISYANWA